MSTTEPDVVRVPDGGPAVVPVHPERTDDPATLRWQLGRGIVTADEPGTCADLVALTEDGTLAGFVVAGDHVRTTLATGRGWPDAAPRVRAAVQAAVRADNLRLATCDRAELDAVIDRLAREVVAAVVGPVATGHGGSVEVLAVRDGVVGVRLRGACAGCPASSATVHGLLQAELRRLLPGVPVTVAAEPTTGRAVSGRVTTGTTDQATGRRPGRVAIRLTRRPADPVA